MDDDERRRRSGERDVQLAQAMLCAATSAGSTTITWSNSRPFACARRQQRDAVEGALVGERRLDELVRDDQRDEPVLARQPRRLVVGLGQQRVLVDLPDQRLGRPSR